MILRPRGFTLVELLIVIVVIAILAAISVAAYNGIQDRAADSAIQSDIRNFVAKVQIYQVDNDKYPRGGQASGNSTAFPGFTFKPTKDAYDITIANLSYCDGTISGVSAFAVMAKSKSGNVFSYSTTEGFRNRGKVSMGITLTCSGMDSGTTSYSYGYNPAPQYGWFNWTNG